MVNQILCFLVIYFNSEFWCLPGCHTSCGVREPSAVAAQKSLVNIHISVLEKLHFRIPSALPESHIKEIRGRELLIGDDKSFIILVFEVSAQVSSVPSFTLSC